MQLVFEFVRIMKDDTGFRRVGYEESEFFFFVIVFSKPEMASNYTIPIEVE